MQRSRRRARFAGAGFRADPSTGDDADAVVRAARDALARARRAPEEIDAIVLTRGNPEVLTALFGAQTPTIAESSRPLPDAIAAIESGRARRVLVLEQHRASIAQAAVLEPTNDGSPPFAVGARPRASQVGIGPEPSSTTPEQALRAIGQEVPLPPSLTIGLVAANSMAIDVSRWIRTLGLRGSALILERSERLERLVDHARGLIASGNGTAFLVTDAERFVLVTSAGFRAATKT
ncbi:MAG: hypothetical protein IPH13_10400 [Planctomycetes bacterium]|nr:hypothetical protein [Planctomycetota bacterium]